MEAILGRGHRVVGVCGYFVGLQALPLLVGFLHVNVHLLEFHEDLFVGGTAATSALLLVCLALFCCFELIRLFFVSHLLHPF